MRRPAIVLVTLVSLASGPSRPEAADKVAALAAPQRTQVLVDAASQAWLSAEWSSYAARFVTPDGRVVDNGNGNVSHSEGQGYGLLLAARAGDAARFETIWQWTSQRLRVRPDGLLAWKWDPSADKVADTNNATDGDILVAWGLAEGARRFGRPDYREAAAAIAQAVGATSLVATKAGPALRPGTKGFGAGEQPDGPVVNLSYWVFPAFPVLKELAPSIDWAAVRHTGLALLQESRFGTFGLPTDWESAAGLHPRPAAMFRAEFGYNAIRIPLYLAWDGSPETRRALQRFAGAWAETASTGQLLDTREAAVTLPVAQPGYDLVLAMARCGAGQAIPPEMIQARSPLYYPETLRLLSVMAIQERFPACL